MEIEFQKAELPCLTAVLNEIQNGEQTQELRTSIENYQLTCKA